MAATVLHYSETEARGVLLRHSTHSITGEVLLNGGGKPRGVKARAPVAEFSLARRRTSSPKRRSSLSQRYNALEGMAQVVADSERLRRRHSSRGPLRQRLDAGEEAERRRPCGELAIERQYDALDAAAGAPEDGAKASPAARAADNQGRRARTWPAAGKRGAVARGARAAAGRLGDKLLSVCGAFGCSGCVLGPCSILTRLGDRRAA
mmetsp:Transcript_21791/g.61914  ORF Transcript_21791/g.61914 Transcript_21791/m.61914 type:complete len:207 (-) Transcript_21791:88-708(-)